MSLLGRLSHVLNRSPRKFRNCLLSATNNRIPLSIDLHRAILNDPTILQGLQNPSAACIAYTIVSVYEYMPTTETKLLMLVELVLPHYEESFNCNPQE